jgi:hypothetical protein
MISQGTVTRTSFVWSNGMPTWASAESTALALLFDLPPPLPVAADGAISAIEHSVAPYGVSPAPASVSAAGLTNKPSAARVAVPDPESIDESEWSSTPRPWIRYFARMLDISCGGLVLGFTLGWIIPPELLTNTIFNSVAATMLTMLLEPVLLSTWGWTPGKSLLCVRVRDAGGGLLTTSKGYARSWAVAFGGLGLGIPLVSFLTLLVGYNRLTKRGITTWDEKGQLKVTHKDLGWVRVTLAVLVPFIIFAWSAYENVQKR